MFNIKRYILKSSHIWFAFFLIGWETCTFVTVFQVYMNHKTWKDWKQEVAETCYKRMFFHIILFSCDTISNQKKKEFPSCILPFFLQQFILILSFVGRKRYYYPSYDMFLSEIRNANWFTKNNRTSRKRNFGSRKPFWQYT